MKRRMNARTVVPLVVALGLFCWMSIYYIVINTQILQYGIIHLYEPNHIVRWVEFVGSIGMLALGIYVMRNFLRGGKSEQD